jgi:hypothetical protein
VKELAQGVADGPPVGDHLPAGSSVAGGRKDGKRRSTCRIHSIDGSI